MNVDSRLSVVWVRDVLIAYAGGLVLGTPFALVAVWLTGRDSAASVSLLTAMVVLFLGLRRRDGRRLEHPIAVDPVAGTRRAA